MSDDLLAIAAGLTSGIEKIAVPYFQMSYQDRLNREKEKRGLEQQRTLNAEERAARRIKVPGAFAEKIGLAEGEYDPAIVTAAGTLAGKSATRKKVLISEARALELEKTGKLDPEVDYEIFNKKSELDPSGMRTTTQNAAFKLHDDYVKDSGDFPKMRDFYNRINASAKDPSAAGDLALIFNYMKLLDPTSVVREGEFATAQNSGSVPARIQAQYNKVMQGERLNSTIRNDFANRSKRLYRGSLEQQKKVDKQYSERAKKFGVDPSLVVSDQSAVSDIPDENIAVPKLRAGRLSSDDIFNDILNRRKVAAP